MTTQGKPSWDDVPLKYNWIAMDQNWRWDAYVDKPIKFSICWDSKDDGPYLAIVAGDYKRPPASHWRDTLEPRPTADEGVVTFDCKLAAFAAPVTFSRTFTLESTGSGKGVIDFGQEYHATFVPVKPEPPPLSLLEACELGLKTIAGLTPFPNGRTPLRDDIESVADKADKVREQLRAAIAAARLREAQS